MMRIQTEPKHHKVVGTWGTVVDKEDFHFTYYDRKTIKFAIYADNTFDKFLINTDDVYSYNGDRHYSMKLYAGLFEDMVFRRYIQRRTGGG
jgi:hypothetical protein